MCLFVLRRGLQRRGSGTSLALLVADGVANLFSKSKTSSDPERSRY